MARPLRLEYENGVYHVTARGNERKKIFLDDRDFRKMMALLEKNVERHGVRLFCFALMNNHYHLLIQTPAANLSDFMHGVQSHYTGYFNWRHERDGHLFQGRYKALIVEKDAYLMRLSRYIHLNPVRAGLVDLPEKWRWSSYGDYISTRSYNKWIETEDVLRYYGRNRTQAIKEYRRTIESAIKEDPDDIMKNVTAQLIIGSKDFVEKIKGMIKIGGEIPFSDIQSGRQLAKWEREEEKVSLSQ